MYYQPNPVDFLFPHQNDEAHITLNFPAETPYHQLRLSGTIYLEALLQDHSNQVIDARFSLSQKKRLDQLQKESPERYRATFTHDGVKKSDLKTQRAISTGVMLLHHVILNLSGDEGKAIIAIDLNSGTGCRVEIVADSQDRLTQLIDLITKQYYFDDGADPATRENPKLGVVQTSTNGLHVYDVELTENRLMEEKDLELHFGPKIHHYQDCLTESLSKYTSGLHLLQGVPGAGKTSFLNHLTAELAETHRLIYLPAGSFHLVASPDAIGFWLDLAEEAKHGQRNVLVIEDAEALIQARGDVGAGQSSLVSTLLNLSDGLLGNVLNLHVIATINTDYENIDEALLRPGRLRSYYEFGKLSHAQAMRLANHLDRKLPENEREYTLGEVYNGYPMKSSDRANTIGFLATA